jgi:predicted nucleic acid-binding protein
MTSTMVDSSVILDVLTEDATWFEWSSRALADAVEHSRLVINVAIYAEVSARFSRIEDLEEAMPPVLEHEEIPREAAFLAGKAYAAYRRRGGLKLSPLPDFFIGAHAAVRSYRLLTRDPIRVKANFPQVRLITP